MKKFLIISFILITIVCLFSSCSKISKDPIDLAKQLDEVDYVVSIIVDDDEIKDVADNFEIRAKSIEYIVAAIPGYDDEKAGVFVYCDNKTHAERMEDDLLDFLDDNEDDITRGIVERYGKIVFIGCEDVLDDGKK